MQVDGRPVRRAAVDPLLASAGVGYAHATVPTMAADITTARVRAIGAVRKRVGVELPAAVRVAGLDG